MVVIHNVSLTAPNSRTRGDEEYASKMPDLERKASYGVRPQSYDGEGNMTYGRGYDSKSLRGYTGNRLGQNEVPFSASKALYLERN